MTNNRSTLSAKRTATALKASHTRQKNKAARSAASRQAWKTRKEQQRKQKRSADAHKAVAKRKENQRSRNASAAARKAAAVRKANQRAQEASAIAKKAADTRRRRNAAQGKSAVPKRRGGGVSKGVKRAFDPDAYRRRFFPGSDAPDAVLREMHDAIEAEGQAYEDALKSEVLKSDERTAGAAKPS